MTQERIENLFGILEKTGITHFLVVSPESQYYYSGFTGGEAYLLLSKNKYILFTDFRYREQSRKETAENNFKTVIIENSLDKDTAEYIKNAGLKKVGFEDSINFSSYNRITQILSGTEMISVPEVVDMPRIVKDKYELENIKEACRIADTGFSKALEVIKPGMAEREIAAVIEYAMKSEGAQDVSFKTTVASGARSSLPHGTASDKLIENNEIITLDFGAVYKGYCSDITRTVFVGSCSPEQRRIYEIVFEAQLAALEFIKAGISNFDADKRARDIIKAYGYDKEFGHGLGHGVGLKIHEAPRLSPKAPVADLLEGMAVTVEPGIYLENNFGIRIEDTVAVKNSGVDVFTKSPKNIIIL